MSDARDSDARDNDTRDSAEFESFEPPLDDAVRAVLAEPVPEDVMRRVHERAMSLEERAAPSKPPRGWTRRGRMIATYAAGGLAALVLVAIVLMMGPHDAWAQVTETLRGKEWVRLTLKIPPGVPIEGNFQPPEMWFSARHQRMARSFAKSAGFIDFGRKESWRYDPQDDTLRVISTRDAEASEFGFFGLLMALVVPSEAGERLPATNVAILSRERHEVEVAGKRWIEFVFLCRDTERKPKPREMRVTFRVDPQTNLPFEMASTEKLAINDPAAERTYIFDYPASGPADIYALGVPRTAKLVDRRRKPTDNVPAIKEFLAAYEQATKQPIEPYTALVMMTTADNRDVHFAHRVQASAAGVQIETFDLDALLALRQRVWSKEITVPADAEAWWKEQIVKLRLEPGGGGRWLVPHEVGLPKMSGRPTLEATVPTLDSLHTTVTVDWQPKIGPPGTVLVRVLVESPPSFNDASYWIDPKRGYQVVRLELRHVRERKDWDIRVETIDEMAQSPGGRWYAKQFRIGQVQKSGDELPAKVADGQVGTSVYRYHVEFQK